MERVLEVDSNHFLSHGYLIFKEYFQTSILFIYQNREKGITRQRRTIN